MSRGRGLLISSRYVQGIIDEPAPSRSPFLAYVVDGNDYYDPRRALQLRRIRLRGSNHRGEHLSPPESFGQTYISPSQTPMGALSVVISSILSHFFLKERLSLFGWISSIQCLLGASILALNGPEEQSVSTIEGFKHLFLAPWFLAYGGVVLVVAAFLALYAAPKWGHKSMMPYLVSCVP